MQAASDIVIYQFSVLYMCLSGCL